MESISGGFRRALAEQFELHEEIGRGGTAAVYRATRLSDGMPVALKVLSPTLRAVLGPERFLREIAILSKLEHAGILPVVASGEAGGQLYFAMPFVAGGSLRDRMQREPHLPIEEALSIVDDVLAALEYAHQQNVVHRDIKPANILLADGRAIVTDFGIARAILRSSDETISSTGVAIGTPAYMSPEQAAGEARVDGRTDIYAVGCVLYEMLAGNPPFTGASEQAIRARHAIESPPPLRIVRPAVSERLQQLVEKALAKVPADRFQSAAAFRAALSNATQTTPSRSVAAARRRLRIGLTATAAVTVAVLLLRPRPDPGPDPDRYIVLPFRQEGMASGSPFGGGNVSRMVWQSLSRWRDLKLVDEFLVEDRLRVRGPEPLTLSSAVRLARSLDAGRLVWGVVTMEDDSTTVRLALFETGRDPPQTVSRAQATFSLQSEDPAASTAARRLAHRLAGLTQSLLSPLSADSMAGPLADTPYLGALLAMLVGDSALAIWDLGTARLHYQRAFTLDPAFAAPRLRFARASLWANRPVGEWLPAAEVAATDPGRLSSFERLEAQALVALGQGDFPKACEGFRRILAQDSLRIIGWLGVGECLTRDSIVVPDAESPSGWSFRGSYNAGIAAYSRALTMVPSSHLAFGGAALRGLSRKLMAEPNLLRRGVAAAEPRNRFAASPSLVADSLAFIPYPLEDAVAGRHIPATKVAALQANRRTLRSITGEWIQRFPSSIGAITAHAEALELTGELDPAPPQPSALALVRQLRQRPHLGKDPALAAWEVRLLIKTRRFTAARAVAESALAFPARSPEDGQLLAALAGVLGQVHRAAGLLGDYGEGPFARSNGEFLIPPRELSREAHRLLVYAAFGSPGDSVRLIADRVKRLVDRYLEVSRREAMREALLFLPSLLAFPVLPPPTDRIFPVSRVEQAIAEGAIEVARRELVSLDSLRSAQLPAAIAPDHALLEARLYAMIGDSGAATRRLEAMLETPSLLGTDILSDVAQAAAIGRALALLDSLKHGSGSRGRDTAFQALWRPSDRR